MKTKPLASIFVAFLLTGFIWCAAAVCQEDRHGSEMNQFAVGTLQEAEALARKLPAETRVPVLARIAAELDRFEGNVPANKLWSEVDQLYQTSGEQSYRDSLLKTLAQERTRSGNEEVAKDLVSKIAAPQPRHEAIQQVARILCEQTKYEDAVIYAESIPRSSGVLFNTMQEIALAAAEGGDVKSAYRASRGMNPQGGLMPRKLRIISRMCSFFFRTGNKNEAIRFMTEGKKLADIARLDLETDLVIDTTLAAMKSEDFEADLKKILERLDGEPIEAVAKDLVRTGIAGVVLDFKHPDLLKHFSGGSKDFRWAIDDVLKARHIVEVGNAEAVKTLEQHPNALIMVSGLARLAEECVEEERSDAAKSHLERAEKVVRSHMAKDKRHPSFLLFFSELVSAKSIAGQHHEALTLVKEYPEPEKIPELMIEVVASLKENSVTEF